MQKNDFLIPIENMVGEFEDFIGVWDNFFPKPLCDDVIAKMELIISQSSNVMNGNRQFSEKKLGRNDVSFMLNDFSAELSNKVNEYLTCCATHYTSEYDQLRQVNIKSFHVKAQKTPPKGGYHVWHYESMSFETSTRELVWMIYLNDMPNGEGETEFLYQKRRINPKAGRVVIFPAGLTHVHRGLTVYTQNKYILTGWFNKVQV